MKFFFIKKNFKSTVQKCHLQLKYKNLVFFQFLKKRFSTFLFELIEFLSGVVNKHNCRIWSENNPFMAIEVALNSHKIIVWCAVSSNEIARPFFFEELTVNQENYLDMLESFF